LDEDNDINIFSIKRIHDIAKEKESIDYSEKQFGFFYFVP